MRTGAGAFFFGATGAAVSSDGSLFGEMVAVVSSGSSLDGTGEVVSFDGSLFGGTVAAESSGSVFDGTGAVPGFGGSVFGARGRDVRLVGRGRGNGLSNGAGNELSRCRLLLVPVTRLNQLEMSCAISDRGDRASVRAGDGGCAFTDAAPNVARNREKMTAVKSRTCAVSIRRAPNKL
jgi:hypothetical protein